MRPRAVGANLKTVVPFAEGTEGVDLQMQQLIETLTETNRQLADIADAGRKTLRLIPWFVSAACVLWPVAGKVISGLPPLPG